MYILKVAFIELGHALHMLGSRLSNTARQLTCPRHPSEAEAAPHPWLRPARDRLCHRSATWRVVPPGDRHLEDDSDNSSRRLLLTIDDGTAGESEQETR